MILTTKYPCCGRPARLTIDDRLRVQTVERLRHFCEDDDETGVAYRITITHLGAPIPGMDIHSIEWIDLNSREAVHLYGRGRIPRHTGSRSA